MPPLLAHSTRLCRETYAFAALIFYGANRFHTESLIDDVPILRSLAPSRLAFLDKFSVSLQPEAAAYATGFFSMLKGTGVRSVRIRITSASD